MIRQFTLVVLVFCLTLISGCSSESDSGVASYISDKYSFKPEIISVDAFTFSCRDESGKTFKVYTDGNNFVDDYQHDQIMKSISDIINCDNVDIAYGMDFMVNAYFDGKNFGDVLKGGTLVVQYIKNPTDDFEMDRLLRTFGVATAYALNVKKPIDASGLLDSSKSIDDYMLDVLDYNTSFSGYNKFNITRYKGMIFIGDVDLERIPSIDLNNFYTHTIQSKQKAVLKSYQISNLKNTTLKILIPVDKIHSSDLLAYRYTKNYNVFYHTNTFTLTDDGCYYESVFEYDADSLKFTIIKGE